VAELTIGEIARGLWSVGLPVFLMGLIIYALNQRMYVHHKELEVAEARTAKISADYEARIAKLDAKIMNYEDIVFRLSGINEKLIRVTEVAVKK
jgi:hypothetical protein